MATPRSANSCRSVLQVLRLLPMHHLKLHHSSLNFLFISPFSSSRKYSPNFYLRKTRKWPFPPYKAQFQQMLNQRKSLQNLKQLVKTNPTHLLSALIQSFNRHNCHPTPKVYHFILKTLTRTPNSHDQIIQVLHHLQNVKNFEIPEFIFVELMKFYGNSNMLEQSIELFFRIPTFRCTPTLVSLNCLLSLLCKKKEGLDIVPEILIKSHRLMNVQIGESSFFILIRALCKIRKVNYAIELVNTMVNEGFSLDAKICSLILSVMCEQKDFRCVEIMSFLEKSKKKGFCPNRVDWCNVIRCLVKLRKGMDALDVLNQMKINGIEPDIVNYTMVLDMLFFEGEYANAGQLFDEMLVLGLIPDIYTYNVYINGLCKQNKVEDGIKMLAWMEELGCKPDLITYNTLLGTLCRSGEVSRAKDIVREMEFKGYAVKLTNICDYDKWFG